MIPALGLHTKYHGLSDVVEVIGLAGNLGNLGHAISATQSRLCNLGGAI